MKIALRVNPTFLELQREYLPIGKSRELCFGYIESGSGASTHTMRTDRDSVERAMNEFRRRVAVWSDRRQSWNAVLQRAGVSPSAVGQVIGGCINKVGAQAMNVTRTAWLTGGGPDEVACSTVDSQCGSGQYATNLAASLITSGAVACGVENMSLLPIGSDAIAGRRRGLVSR